MEKDSLVAAVINFNTAHLTSQCTRSLLDAGIANVLVLDNGSIREDYFRLEAAHAEYGGRVRIIRSETNLGFAQGSNRLIEEALRSPGCRRILLLNSDAVVVASGLDACLGQMEQAGHQLMGGRMLKPGAGDVESLGVTLYKSLLASNRKSTADAYLGPTGGFAIYSREFLDDMKQAHGYVFDPTYFCYAEDTDLCVRARLRGHSAGYADEVVAYHAGQGSLAGPQDDFILYHGIRNSIWMVAKSIPLPILLARLHWVALLHGGIVLRHTLSGKWRTLFRLYRDAICGIPAVMAKRRVVQASRRIAIADFKPFIDAKFYERAYLKNAVRGLFRR
jgi:GT2 family glycosyltransferase